MKDGFRQCMAWLHTWTGLVVGWVLFFVFATGTAGYFNQEITRWMQPELPLAQSPASLPDTPTLIDRALTRLEQVGPGAAHWNITLPHESLSPRGWQDLAISWETLPQEGHEYGVYSDETLDVRTGLPLQTPEPRATGGGGELYYMHYALHYIPYGVAFRLVGVCTMLMLLAIVTGVITHKKIFKDFFTFRPRKGQRSWLDAHNLVSVMALPFFLVITYSGLLFFQTDYMPAGVAAVYGTDEQSVERFYDEVYPHGDHKHLAVHRPGASVADMVRTAEAQWGTGQVATITIAHESDAPPYVDLQRINGGQVLFYHASKLRFHAQTGASLPGEPPDSATVLTNETLFALHEGHFATPWLRGLYFIAGLLGCAMIATGLVLWTVKRRKNHEDLGNADGGVGLRLVEALNLGTVAGLPVAIAAYFWANRLLPLDLADRAAWEMHTLFVVWGQMLLYAFLRPGRRSWVEMLWIAAAAFGLLPLLNLVTTDRHLGITLPAGDWVLAGFDLVVLGLALVFAYAAIKVGRKQAAAESDSGSADMETA